jgi:hypothetical protein
MSMERQSTRRASAKKAAHESDTKEEEQNRRRKQQTSEWELMSGKGKCGDKTVNAPISLALGKAVKVHGVECEAEMTRDWSRLGDSSRTLEGCLSCRCWPPKADDKRNVKLACLRLSQLLKRRGRDWAPSIRGLIIEIKSIVVVDRLFLLWWGVVVVMS